MNYSIEALIEKAILAREFSYSPYSGFCVGAAVLTSTGEIFSGCNIENVAFSPALCAERVAISKAVSEGARKFTAIAVVGGDSYTAPCGVCRQALAEFCDDSLVVIMAKSATDHKICTLGELFPLAFRTFEEGKKP